MLEEDGVNSARFPVKLNMRPDARRDFIAQRAKVGDFIGFVRFASVSLMIGREVEAVELFVYFRFVEQIRIIRI